MRVRVLSRETGTETAEDREGDTEGERERW